MEILSTGEKVKKARVYKGLTLKELCEDKVSVSKMSCIENNKIKAEPWILEFISKKLEIEYEYLKKDVEDHLLENLKLIEKMPKEKNDYENNLIYNLEYAEEYNHYDISMKLIHLLFEYYLMKEDIKSLEDIQCRYYNVYEKVYSDKHHQIYYTDIANYLYATGEYLQAANYYNNVKHSLLKEKEDNEEYYETIVNIISKETYCYIKEQKYSKAYELSKQVNEYIDLIEDDLIKAKSYHMMAFLCLRMSDPNFTKYEKKSFKFYKENNFEKSKALNEYASTMLEIGLRAEALEYIEKGLVTCPKEQKSKFIEYLIIVTETLIKGEFLKRAEEVGDEALNIAIELNDVVLIERAYYNKATICMKQQSHYSAEMYMNLSLDALVKFGTKAQIYKRYLQMGEMYYKIKNTTEALKYFNLAIKMETYI